MFVDYYKILEIEKNSTQQEIKTAFRKQAIKWHPDKNPDIDVNEKMQLKKEKHKVYEEYNFDDETLKRWMQNAKKQAVDLAKQTIREMGELSVKATKEAGSTMFESFVYYAISGLIILIIFKACN
jgi:DnaJ-class molecular chaperone